MKRLFEFSEFKPTNSWMATKFNELNRICFDNKLPLCTLRLSRLSKNMLGNFAPHADQNIYTDKSGNIFARPKITVDKYSTDIPIRITDDWIKEHCKPVISLSTLYSMNEKEWLSVLLHEMCHYSTFLKGKMDPAKENNSHGKIFHNECVEAAKKMGSGWTSNYIETSEDLKEVVDDDAVKQTMSRITAGYIVLAIYKANKYKEPVILGFLTKEWSLVQELYKFSLKDENLTGIAYLDDKELYAKLSLRYKTSKQAISGNKFTAGFNSETESCKEIIEEIRTNKNLKIILDRSLGIDVKIDLGNSVKKGPFCYTIITEDKTGKKIMYLCLKGSYDKVIADIKDFVEEEELIHIYVYDDQDLSYSILESGYKKTQSGYGSRYNITNNENLLKRIENYKNQDLI